MRCIDQRACIFYAGDGDSLGPGFCPNRRISDRFHRFITFVSELRFLINACVYHRFNFIYIPGIHAACAYCTTPPHDFLLLHPHTWVWRPLPRRRLAAFAASNGLRRSSRHIRRFALLPPSTWIDSSMAFRFRVFDAYAGTTALRKYSSIGIATCANRSLKEFSENWWNEGSMPLSTPWRIRTLWTDDGGDGGMGQVG